MPDEAKAHLKHGFRSGCDVRAYRRDQQERRRNRSQEEDQPIVQEVTAKREGKTIAEVRSILA